MFRPAYDTFQTKQITDGNNKQEKIVYLRPPMVKCIGLIMLNAMVIDIRKVIDTHHTSMDKVFTSSIQQARTQLEIYNCWSSFGWRLLSNSNNPDLIRSLVAFVDVNSLDDDGKTPLMCAVLNGNQQATDALLSMEQTDLNAQNAVTGKTALMYAVAPGAVKTAWHLSCLASLSKHPKTNLSLKDKADQTAFTLSDAGRPQFSDIDHIMAVLNSDALFLDRQTFATKAYNVLNTEQARKDGKLVII